MSEERRDYCTLVSSDGKNFAIGFINPEIEDLPEDGRTVVYLNFTDCCLYTLVFDIMEYLKKKHPCEEPGRAIYR
jgi:hypothetical protein